MTFPSRLNLQVTLNGVDITSEINSQIRVSNTLTKQSDSCKFSIKDTSSLTLTKWDEVVVLDGSTKLFAGYYLEDRGKTFGIKDDLSLEFSDYAVLLEKIKIKAEYENMTDAAIIADLVSTYLPAGWDGTTHVEEIKTLERIRFNRISITEALGALADRANADWYVDHDKQIHFFLNETNLAPFAISSDESEIDLSTVYPGEKFDVERTAIEVVNRVEVVGGFYRSEDQTFYIAGTGQDNRAQLPFKMYAPDGETSLLVERNDGTESSPVWTSLTVKVGYIDELTGTDEVLHYFNEKVLEQQNNWPNLPNAIKVTGQYDVPLRVRVRDDNSRDLYDVGVYLDAIIVDKDITTKKDGRLAGQALLAQKAFERETVDFEVRAHGLRSGQIINVRQDALNVDDDFLIRRVTAEIEPGGHAVYRVSCGGYSEDLVDLLIKIARLKNIEDTWRDDEVLDELLVQNEDLALTEGTPTVTPDTSPYNWGADADELVWDFGRWEPI